MDFSLIMFLALLVTGGIWILDKLLAETGRKKKVESLRKAGGSEEALRLIGKEPLLVEYARTFFPVILAVFLLRSFLVEPFRIPSGSMLPNLRAGDFILVNKFAYGIRLPIINEKLLETGQPHRGDVMVFRYPRDPGVNYIKRVIGLPGDTIVYSNKKLFINGKAVTYSDAGTFTYEDEHGSETGYQQFNEELDTLQHKIIILPGLSDFGNAEVTVPNGHYFVMGDNRDNSNDSRVWGFVPDNHLVGRAFLVWFSWNYSKSGDRILWKRIGNPIN